MTDSRDSLGAMIRERPLAYLAGAVGIVGQLAAAYLFLLLPMLAVPSPANSMFYIAWVVLAGLAIAWWRRHPIRSFFVPIVSVPVAVLVLWIGDTFLGWGP